MIHIIVDNATYYQSPLVKEYLKTTDSGTFFTGLFAELELDGTLVEVFQEENTVQQVLRNV